MSQVPSPKSVRKGAKSCSECRRHKVRCVWPGEGGETCQRCMARSRKCELQVHMVPTSATVTGTSRARILKLESEVSDLYSTVRSLEAKLGCLPGEVVGSTLAPSQAANGQGPQSSPHEDGGESNVSEASSMQPPRHLLQLFDNGLLDSCEHESVSPSSPALRVHKAHNSYTLRQLLPSRRDMCIITTYASPWIFLHNAILPMASLSKTSDAMLVRFDELQDQNSDPVDLAALLICIAITVQQSPDETAGRAAESIKDAASFVEDVSDSIERIFISDDAFSATLEGIETTVLFLRLQLSRGKMKKVWLLKKRVIALAELIGLPRTSMAISASLERQQPEAPSSVANLQRNRNEMWESICAVDRITSLMWSLPLGTSNYSILSRPVVDSHGQVNPQAYLYRLTDIASHIIEQDNVYSSQKSLTDLFSSVMDTDQELRTLAALPPKGWRKLHWTEPSIDAILQYWHQYLIIRTHLQLALKYYDGQEFAFSFITCLDACQELVRRYTSMRLVLPAGFFPNRMMDLQAFTASIFLLLTNYGNVRGSSMSLLAVDVNVTSSLVDQAVQTMRFAAERTGGDFAHQAADAIYSLNSLLQQPQASESQKISLNLAFVGRVHVSRKACGTGSISNQPHLIPSQQPQEPFHLTTSRDESAGAASAVAFKPHNDDLMHSLSYSMEVQENIPFLNDETLGAEQWLTWTGLGT